MKYFLALIALVFAASVSADECGNNIVIVSQKSQSEFVSFPMRFDKQHDAEEFADSINAAPIVKDKRAKITIKQKAVVYAK